MRWIDGAAMAAGALLLSGLGALVLAATAPIVAQQEHHPTKALTADAAPVRQPATLDSLVVVRNLFRSSRSPAPVPFDPVGSQPSAAPPDPLPTFSLVGLALGPARAALLRGIPGLDGAQLLAEGDELGGLRLVRVERDRVQVVWRGERQWLALPTEAW